MPAETQTTHAKYCLPEGLPAPRAAHDGLDREFWEAARRHELVVQRCNDCEGFQFGPEWICHNAAPSTSVGIACRRADECTVGSAYGIQCILRSRTHVLIWWCWSSCPMPATYAW